MLMPGAKKGSLKANRTNAKEICRSKGFIDQRTSLDETGVLVRVPRTCGAFQVHWERSQSRYLDYPARGRKDQQKVREALFQSGHDHAGMHLQVLGSVFPQKEYLDYDGIDQGQEGACSLVGFLNLVTINRLLGNGIELEFKGDGGTNFDHNDVIEYWGSIWDAMQPYAEKQGMQDIASMLDAAKALGLLAKMEEKITYIPIRSYGFRENKFNKQIVSSSTLGEAAAEIKDFFKTLINHNIPFAVNCDEHTRVCVGYTDKDFVFADSWGSDMVQAEFDPSDQRINFITAGYSFSPIEHIATWAKDIVTLQQVSFVGIDKNRNEQGVINLIENLFSHYSKEMK